MYERMNGGRSDFGRCYRQHRFGRWFSVIADFVEKKFQEVQPLLRLLSVSRNSVVRPEDAELLEQSFDFYQPFAPGSAPPRTKVISCTAGPGKKPLPTFWVRSIQVGR